VKTADAEHHSVLAIKEKGIIAVKWFKHMADSGDDPHIGELIDELNFKGYYLFFRTLEILSREFNPEKPGEIYGKFSWFFNRFHKKIDRKNLIKFLNLCQKQGRFDYKIEGRDIWIKCFKFKELADQYSDRLVRDKYVQSKHFLRTNVRTKSFNKKKEVRSKKKEYKYNTLHLQNAEYLKSQIKHRIPRHNFNTNDYLEQWANTFRIMEEKKEATSKEIRMLITVIFHDDFWYKNILSADKLRKQFGRLWAELIDEPRNGKRGHNNPQLYVGQRKAKTTDGEKKAMERFKTLRKECADIVNKKYQTRIKDARSKKDVEAMEVLEDQMNTEIAQMVNEKQGVE